MFKHFLTVLKADHARAEEQFEEHHALTILEQQLREAATRLDASKRAVALAIAQATQERRALDRLAERIRALEARAVAAIEGGKDELAEEAAGTIASLEAERDASARALDRMDEEVKRLRETVRAGEARLRALRRGHRVAGARERSQRLRESVAAVPGNTGLADAEGTLRRLAERQERDELAAAALSEMDAGHNARNLDERMAAAGCGAPIVTPASAVLDRLRERAGAPGVAKPA